MLKSMTYVAQNTLPRKSQFTFISETISDSPDLKCFEGEKHIDFFIFLFHRSIGSMHSARLREKKKKNLHKATVAFV